MVRNISADAVLDRLALGLGLKNDADLARLLETGASTISSWRKRNSVPFAKCVDFAVKRGLSLDWLLIGEGERFRDADAGASSKVATETARESAVLSLFRQLSDDDQHEIQLVAQGKKRLRDVEQRLEQVTTALADLCAA